MNFAGGKKMLEKSNLPPSRDESYNACCLYGEATNSPLSISICLPQMRGEDKEIINRPEI